MPSGVARIPWGAPPPSDSTDVKIVYRPLAGSIRTTPTVGTVTRMSASRVTAMPIGSTMYPSDVTGDAVREVASRAKTRQQGALPLCQVTVTKSPGTRVAAHVSDGRNVEAMVALQACALERRSLWQEVAMRMAPEILRPQ